MARDHARTYVDIWGDDDWLDLSVEAQLLYFTLHTSADLSLCGSGTWHVGRIQNMARTWTSERIEEAAAELSRGMFLIIDTRTEEYLLRSWIKHDGLWRTPNMAVSVAKARASLASRTLRGIVVFEVLKLREKDPGSSSWQKPAVEKMLDQRAIDPATIAPYNPGPKGGSNGEPNGVSNPDSNGAANPYGHPGPNPGSNGGPTPTPATNSSSESTNVLSLNERASETEFRRIPIPDDWAPNDLHRARFPDLDLAAQADDFRDHAVSQGRLCDRRAGWDAAFSRWCSESKRRSAKDAADRPKHKMRAVAEQTAQARQRENRTQQPPAHSDPRAITG